MTLDLCFDNPALDELWTRLCLRRGIFNTINPPQIILDWIYGMPNVDRDVVDRIETYWWRHHSEHPPTLKAGIAANLSLRGCNVAARSYTRDAAVASYDVGSFSYESPETQVQVQLDIFDRIDSIVKAFEQLGLEALRLPLLEHDSSFTLEVFTLAKGQSDPLYPVVSDWCHWHSNAQLKSKMEHLMSFVNVSSGRALQICQEGT